MSAQAEPTAPISAAPVPAPATELEEVPATEPAEVTSQRKFLAHVKQYPVANSAKEMVLSVPGAKEVMATVAPALKTVREIQPIKYVVDTGDVIADSALSQIDGYFPNLRTLKVNDLSETITRPINSTVHSTQVTLDAAHDTILKTVIEPAAKNVSGLRYSFNTLVFDNNGKGIITSQADPIVAPVNESIEKFITVWFPGTQKVSKEHSSEIARSILMLNNVLTQKRQEPTTEATITSDNAETTEPVEAAPIEESAQQ